MSVVLQTRNLEKIYDKTVRAVQGIDLDLYKGEVLGLLGPNGAGKSTFIKMLVGILKPNEGEISFNQVLTKNEKKLAGLLGYAPQELVFYTFLTVLENMKLYASLYKVPNVSERIFDLMELFQLSELSDRRAEKMSGGQKRRLNVAISLLHSPKILILDEPSAGMDPQSRNVLWESIDKLVEQEGITVILATHLMEVADRLCDRVAIIDNGTILTIGTPDELKIDNKSDEIIEIQFSKRIEKVAYTTVVDSLTTGFPQLSFENDRIFIKTTNGVSDIGKVMDIIEEQKSISYLQDIQLRIGTLDDVFLKLTGRKLREGDNGNNTQGSEKQ